MTDSIDEVLEDRGKKYGNFVTMCEAINDLHRVIGRYGNPKGMTDAQYHGLGMIMVKIGRILTGDPDYDDNWRDIAGYATKVLETLQPTDPSAEE